MAVAVAQQQAQVASGQPDYSKQWAEYYRSIGKIEEAEAIENQIKSKVSAAQNSEEAYHCILLEKSKFRRNFFSFILSTRINCNKFFSIRNGMHIY